MRYLLKQSHTWWFYPLLLSFLGIVAIACGQELEPHFVQSKSQSLHALPEKPRTLKPTKHINLLVKFKPHIDLSTIEEVEAEPGPKELYQPSKPFPIDALQVPQAVKAKLKLHKAKSVAKFTKHENIFPSAINLIRLRVKGNEQSALTSFLKSHPDVEYVEEDLQGRADLHVSDDEPMTYLDECDYSDGNCATSEAIYQWALRNPGCQDPASSDFLNTGNINDRCLTTQDYSPSEDIIIAGKGLVTFNGAVKDADSAWYEALKKFGPGEEEVIVAVWDGLVDTEHPDLQDRIWRCPADSETCTEGSVGAPEDLNDWNWHPVAFSWHGTHVAGIIAADGNNEEGIAGFCPNCKIMRLALPAFDSYNELADRLAYAADNGAKVINMSFGLGFNPSQTLENIFNDLQAANVLLIASAGNHQGNASNTETGYVKQYPCSYESVLCVANTTWNDTLFMSSTYHELVDVSAPGAVIVSTSSRPAFVDDLRSMVDNGETDFACDTQTPCSTDDDCPGSYFEFCDSDTGLCACTYYDSISFTASDLGIPVYDSTGAPLPFFVGEPDPNESHAISSGTSMSAPMVSGLAGLLLSHKPDLSVDQLKHLISHYADPVDHLSPTLCDEGSCEGMMGSGRINARKSLGRLYPLDYNADDAGGPTVAPIYPDKPKKPKPIGVASIHDQRQRGTEKEPQEKKSSDARSIGKKKKADKPQSLNETCSTDEDCDASPQASTEAKKKPKKTKKGPKKATSAAASNG